MQDDIVCVMLAGGLGNQMFQYAAGRSLSLCRQATLFTDDGWFRNATGGTPRTQDILRFPAFFGGRLAVAPPCLSGRLRGTSEPLWRRAVRKLLGVPRWQPAHCMVEDQAAPVVDFSARSLPLYLEGYWQSEAYFAEYASTIRADFTFPELVCEKALALAKEVHSGDDSVSVHVRRGDYVADATTNAWHGVCGMEYYAKAMQHVEETVSAPRYFVFSDDPEWCRAAFSSCRYQVTVVDVHGEHDAIHDMHLMTLCRHHIVANSSFSWWGAWLSQREGMVVAPQRWFAAPSLAHVNPSPSRWLRI